MHRLFRVFLLLIALGAAGAVFAACGGDDSTAGTSAPPSGASPATAKAGSSQAASADPKQDGYACSLLTQPEIEAVTGGPAKAGTHHTATVNSVGASTDCDVLSAADCPQNLPKETPFCDKAYRVAWSVVVYPNAAAARAALDAARAGGSPLSLTIAGADAGAFYRNGAALAEKGTAVVTMGYDPPTALSGNAAVARRTVAGQDQPSAKLLESIMKHLP